MRTVRNVPERRSGQDRSERAEGTGSSAPRQRAANGPTAAPKRPVFSFCDTLASSCPALLPRARRATAIAGSTNSGGHKQRGLPAEPRVSRPLAPLTARTRTRLHGHGPHTKRSAASPDKSTSPAASTESSSAFHMVLCLRVHYTQVPSQRRHHE